jgi:hypothetical protein
MKNKIIKIKYNSEPEVIGDGGRPKGKSIIDYTEEIRLIYNCFNLEEKNDTDNR